MKKVDTTLRKINKTICRNIAVFGSTDRGMLSQNILAQLRNPVEHTALKIWRGGRDLKGKLCSADTNPDNMKTRVNADGFGSTDNDDDSIATVVPVQAACAVSIYNTNKLKYRP